MIDNTLKYDEPIFPISVAAKLLSISVPTLRMYEKEGLIIPHKKASNQRLYSQSDLERIRCIRSAISEDKISINGIKTIYSMIPCWEVVGCSKDDKNKCDAFAGHSKPCWSYKNPDTVCEEKVCRDCEVYNKYSECGKVKDLITSLSGS